MTVRTLIGAAVLAAVLVPLTAQASPVPPACVVVDQAPVQVQVGYAPTGPSGCTHVP